MAEMSDTYKIVFKGELRESFSRDDVVKALTQAYHKEHHFFDSWFQQDQVIKHETTLAEAERIKEYLYNLGMIVVIEKIIREQPVQSEQFERPDLFDSPVSSINNTAVIAIQVAPLSRRIGAYILDMILCIICFRILSELILMPIGFVDINLVNQFITELQNSPSQETLQAVINQYMTNETLINTIFKMFMISVTIQLLYFGVMDCYYNATFGKKLFKIKVYSLSGNPLALKQTILRQLYIIVAFFVISIFVNILSFLVLIGVFFMAQRDKQKMNRTIFDLLTKTFVGLDLQSSKIK